MSNSISRRESLRGAALLTLAQILAACSSNDDAGGMNAEGGAPGVDGPDAVGGAGGEGGAPAAGNDYGALEDVGGVIALPQGFGFVAFAAAGSPMSDGGVVPGAHDGMACFAGRGSEVILVRNHELSARDEAAAGGYDALGAGGVTITIFDTETKRELETFEVLRGTIENCNGGTTLGGAWLSCEETTEGEAAGFERPHGYVFEVPAKSRKLMAAPEPLRAMGRFVHEAARQDPDSGVVYMTEDNGDPADGFYRFVPRATEDLARGGRLQALAVVDQPGLVLYTGQTVGMSYTTAWVDIAEPDPENAEEDPGAVFRQGLELGAAQFMGLEGLALADGVAYFVASEAGDAEKGQIWSFTPEGDDGGVLKLLYESTDGAVLDQPDNITISPKGAVLMCEDGDGEDEDGGDNWLRFLAPDGKLYDFARNITPIDLHEIDDEDFPEPGVAFGRSEFSGVCFSPDGKWLFLNVQYPGLTLAITGPWQRGAI